MQGQPAPEGEEGMQEAGVVVGSLPSRKEMRDGRPRFVGSSRISSAAPLQLAAESDTIQNHSISIELQETEDNHLAHPMASIGRC